MIESSENKRPHIFNLLDRMAENPDSLSQEERLQLISMLEEDDANGHVWYDRWVEYRSASFQGQADGYDEEEIQALIRSIVNGFRKQRRIGRLRRTLGFFAKAAAVAAISAASILAYETVGNYMAPSEEEVLAEQIDDAGRLMKLAMAENAVQEYYAPRGSRSRVLLRDSSVVWLDSDSRLTVDSAFGDSLRLVDLDGHALFEVSHNETVPFHVLVGNDMNVKVTGTVFSVKAYREDDYIETVLVDGKIDVAAAGELIRMKPSDKLLVGKNNTGVNFLSQVQTKEKYVVWKDGILIFDDTPMAEVITSIERMYNVTVHIENRDILSYKITAKMDNLSLQQIMDNLSYVSNLKVLINKRDVWLK